MAEQARTDPKLYIRLKKRLTVPPRHTVTLAEAARILTTPERQERLLSLPVYRHQPEDGNRVVIDVLQVIRLLEEAEPGIQIEMYGEPQVLVIVAEKPKEPRLFLLIPVWLLLFFGAGLAIMNFHTDVSMKEVHQRIAELLTGKPFRHPLWFQIPYSFGVGFGMILFFNHLFKKKFNEEPNPLEVELFMYEENVNAAVIEGELRKKTSPGGSGNG